MAKYFTGSVRAPDGSIRKARLVETMNFWSEGRLGRWRKSDGRFAGATAPGYHLILSSIKPEPKVYGASRASTHIARVKRAGKGGQSPWLGVYETKHAWVDGEGRRYRKNDNYFEKGGDHLLIGTIEPYKHPRKPRP